MERMARARRTRAACFFIFPSYSRSRFSSTVGSSFRGVPRVNRISVVVGCRYTHAARGDHGSQIRNPGEPSARIPVSTPSDDDYCGDRSKGSATEQRGRNELDVVVDEGGICEVHDRNAEPSAPRCKTMPAPGLVIPQKLGYERDVKGSGQYAASPVERYQYFFHGRGCRDPPIRDGRL